MIFCIVAAESSSEKLELLLEVGRVMSSKLELSDLLATVLELSSRVVDAESASLLLLDEKSQELYFDVALGLGDEASKFRLPVGQGIAGTVARERKPAIINDVRADARWSPKMDEQSGFTTRSILAVPMLVRGRLIGVVEAINRKEGAFTPEHLRTFEAFSSQASVAIDNARLFSSLKEERLKLSTVFTEMTDGAVLCDPQGQVLLANEAAKRFFGLGTELTSLITALKDMAVTPPLSEVIDSQAASADFWAVRELPKKLILAAKATRIRLGEGGSTRPAATGWLCVFRDATDEVQKEVLKRTFLSLISHKLKTPLASVTGFSEILLAEFAQTPPPPLQLKCAQTIASQGRKLANLVDNLLHYTTLENPDTPLELSPFPIDEAVSGAVKSLKDWLAENKAAVVFSPSGRRVKGDRAYLIEVFKNLIENAVKFDSREGKSVSVWVDEEAGRVGVHVKDEGPGIPPEDQEKIFSRFHQVETSFTGQVEGWGLGLPFVKKVVELHGGELKLTSRLGQGTTASVLLPGAAS